MAERQGGHAMQRIATIIIGWTVVLGGAGVLAHAQPLETMEVDVPFPFTVERTTFPAGTYIVEPADPSVSGSMLLESPDGRQAVEFPTEAMETPAPNHESQLVFDKIGDRNFLSQIWSAGLDQGRALAESGAAVRLERAGREHECRVVKGRPAKSRHGTSKS
jgi:hypothetical protein